MRRFSVCGALAAVLAISPARAEPAPAYRDLLQRYLPSAPALLAQQAEVDAARGDARQARAWRNPTIDVTSENLAVPRDPSGVTQRQTTYTITQPFEIGGKRAARIAAGARDVEAREATAHQSRIAFAARLAVAYASAEAAQDRFALARSDLGRADDAVRAAAALVRAGKEARLRQVQAQASHAAAEAACETAAADLTDALEHLSALIGVRPAFTEVPPTLLDAPSPIAAFAGPGPDGAPAVTMAAAEQRALAAQVRVERTRPIPDIGIGVGLRRYQGVRNTGLVVGVSTTIPLFDGNRGAIDAARARAMAAENRLADARLQADADLQTAIAQLRAAERRMRAAADGEAAATEAYRLARIGYESGKTPLVELLDVRRTLTDARATIIDARLARVRAIAALAMTNGRIAFGD